MRLQNDHRGDDVDIRLIILVASMAVLFTTGLYFYDYNRRGSLIMAIIRQHQDQAALQAEADRQLLVQAQRSKEKEKHLLLGEKEKSEDDDSLFELVIEMDFSSDDILYETDK
jgi:hypothetical protein